ncbi:hypothetical protein ASF91_15100 [Rhizobium sp. Leaf155]|nr:hypothetical protein ASF91_15100 [Rhizobium sp. Leaf155]
MSAEDEQNQGLKEAHTPPEISAERAAKVGSAAALTEVAMAGLAQAVAGEREEPDQPSLLLADPDGDHCLFGGPVRHVASIMDTAKRARGRPKGSQNRRSADLANYLLTMGYRDPALNLADLANADPVDLAQELSQPRKVTSGPNKGDIIEDSMTPADALALIMKANAELMPYFHAKKPQEVHVSKQVMGVMVIGEMPTERRDDKSALDLTAVDAPDQ